MVASHLIFGRRSKASLTLREPSRTSIRLRASATKTLNVSVAGGVCSKFLSSRNFLAHPTLCYSSASLLGLAHRVRKTAPSRRICTAHILFGAFPQARREAQRFPRHEERFPSLSVPGIARYSVVQLLRGHAITSYIVFTLGSPDVLTRERGCSA